MTGSVVLKQKTVPRRANLVAGPYAARMVEDADDLRLCLALRSAVFRKGVADDRDRFDDLAQHVLLTDRREGRAVACFRYRILPPGDLSLGYTAQFYDLAPLVRFGGPMADLGRVAVAPGRGDPDLLRLLLAALTQVALTERVRVIFGCSSLPGANLARHAPTLAWLQTHHAMPLAVTALKAAPRPAYVPPDGRAVPPLLRSYLAMGARVGPDPVADPALDTVHVFTALDLAAVPVPRAHSLMRLMWMASARPAD